MNIKKRILLIGILFLIAGGAIMAGSYEPTRILQYVLVTVTAVAGMTAVVIGRKAKDGFVRSAYYTWIGFILITLAISLGIWATSLMAFINILGFFVMTLGIIEFVFAQQILTIENPIPWKVLAIKLALSIITATGAVWVLTMAEINVHTALLFMGVLLALVGLTFTQLSRLSKSS